MSRRDGRVLAVQALYAYDVGEEPLEDILKLGWTGGAAGAGADEGGAAALSRDFARLLIAGTIGNIDEIDSEIRSRLSAGWDFSRLDRVTLAILRVSVFALLYQKDTDAAVVIDEAVSISRLFNTDDSFKFINAVLDAISAGRRT